MTTVKRCRHKWSPRHYRYGVKLLVRSCLVVGCDATTDGKNILYRDGRIGKLSKEIRRQMSTTFTLCKPKEGGKTDAQ